MFRIFYTTQMSSNARQLQTRFTKMRSKSGRVSKLMATVMAVAIITVMATATVVMAVVDTDAPKAWTYEIYNGDKLVPVTHSPMAYGSEYYVPLRETLNGFGITDIAYADGVATVTVPEDEIIAPFPAGTENYYYREFRINVNDKFPQLRYGDTGIALRGAPFIIDGTMYVSVECIEKLMRHYNSLENFSLNVIKPTEPKFYYEKGEEVVIGTAAEQDEYTKNNPKSIVKRIITDDDGKVMVVVPIENQRREGAEAKYSDVNPALGLNEYYSLCKGASWYETPSGKKFQVTPFYVVYRITGKIGDGYMNDVISYIAMTDFVTIPKSELNEGARSIIINTYDAGK